MVQVGALAPLEAITWPAEPVEPAKAMVEEISMVVTFALAAVVAPIDVLSIVPALMSAVSAIKLSMLAVPSIYKSRHSCPT